MSDRRGPLGKLADEVREHSSVPVYETAEGLPADAIRWSGEGVHEFLNLASRLGVPLVYLHESVVAADDQDPTYADHRGETSFVVVGFFLGGEFHALAKIAEWMPVETGTEDDAEEGTSSFLSRLDDATKTFREKKVELMAEFVKALEARPDPIDPSEASVDQALRVFLAQKLSTPSYTFLSPIHRDGSELDQLVRSVSRTIAGRMLAEERRKVEPLIGDCVWWARQGGIRTLSKSDVEAFLLEKDVAVSREGQRYLWTKAKLAIKTGRPA